MLDYASTTNIGPAPEYTLTISHYPSSREPSPARILDHKSPERVTVTGLVHRVYGLLVAKGIAERPCPDIVLVERISHRFVFQLTEKRGSDTRDLLIDKGTADHVLEAVAVAVAREYQTHQALPYSFTNLLIRPLHESAERDMNYTLTVTFVYAPVARPN